MVSPTMRPVKRNLMVFATKTIALDNGDEGPSVESVGCDINDHRAERWMIAEYDREGFQIARTEWFTDRHELNRASVSLSATRITSSPASRL